MKVIDCSASNFLFYKYWTKISEFIASLHLGVKINKSRLKVLYEAIYFGKSSILTVCTGSEWIGVKGANTSTLCDVYT